MNIVFMGTPDFAAASLSALLQAGHKVSAVFCQPDKPAGRGLRLQACAVKTLALEHDIPVFQPVKLRDGKAAALLASLAPDVIAVVAYGRLLPDEMLRLPPLGCVNVHASLLPALRGAAPIQWAVTRGLTETGVTTQRMVKELDAGDILLQRACPILPRDTAGSLYDRLRDLGAVLLPETLEGLVHGTLRPVPQDPAGVSLAPPLCKEDGRIDWNEPLMAVDCRIRGMNPWPGAYTGALRIHEAFVTGEHSTEAPGTVLPGGCVVCGDGGVLRLETVQRAGGKRMNIEAYLRGHTLEL